VSQYKLDRSHQLIPRVQIWWRALAPLKRGYKLSRSQKTVTMQEFNYVQMSVSGCNSHYEFVLGAGVKAKSVTNNLPILSVLGLGFCQDLLDCPAKMV
jgi:hypothetical protein